MQSHNIRKIGDSTLGESPIFLSERQKQVLGKMCEGKSYQVIADELFISEATVKYHVKNIFAILHVSNKVQAVRIATINNLY